MTATPISNLNRDAIAAKGWFGAHKWLIARRLSQLGILGLFLLGPWAGIWVLKGTLSTSLLLDVVPMTDPLLFVQMLATGFTGIVGTAVIGAAIVAIFYAVVGGRVYCSWVCPVNIVTDTAHWLRRRLGLKSSARISAHARYWMLGMTLVLSYATGTLAYELVNPVSLMHRGIIFGMGFGWSVVLGVFLFDLFVMKHGWCGHLCPMGAFYSLIGQVAIVRVRADRRAQCNNCMECYEVCPEAHVIPPALKGEHKNIGPVILAGDCTNCGRCIDVCSKDVFNFGLRFGHAGQTGVNRPHFDDGQRNTA